MTSDNGVKKSGSVEAAQVGNQFVGIYYPLLQSDPKKTHQFYMDDSKFARKIEDRESRIVVGQQKIYKALENISHEWIVVWDVDTQDAPNGCVLIVVTGRIKRAEKNAEAEDFVQTFVLGPRGSQQGKRQFYVCNDVLRYISNKKKNSKSMPPKGMGGASFTSSKNTEETSKTKAGSESKAKLAAEEKVESEADNEDEKEETAAKVAETVAPMENSKKSQPKPAENSTESKADSSETGTAAAVATSATTAPAPQAEVGAASESSNTGSNDDSRKEEGKKVLKSKRKVNGNIEKKPEAQTEEKEKPVPKEQTKSGPKTWAARFREVRSQPQPNPPVTTGTNTAQPTKPLIKATEEPTTPETETAGVQSQRGRGGRGKKGTRGGKSGRSNFNYHDPELIAKTLYVRGLPPDLEKAAIETKFGEFGQIREIQRPHSNYCFVHYLEKEAVETAMKARPIKLNGEEVKVDKRRPTNRSKGSDQGRGRGGRGRGGRYRHGGRGEVKRLDNGVKRGGKRGGKVPT
mmetsp:Transcript_8222/g.11661  ORF Transcript_8222/g.11661 Transcript_8222/m.11661 type:complete len:518 (+) Transcript_8222:132-1685(+)|eukprot:CAMPEP_0184480442 /NCGR_PEP_ID=MMETSP0113_2-20130426/1953_1 /TAXON_ID=91329 /ORGANISM="Norrisiella sphaerica, Strain BC52" /LENGTH=517 /DNA_ID=CAMNT_0026858931 /DNA_START=86 /DNA_END=1639 /DNA_ORIENTATION=+